MEPGKTGVTQKLNIGLPRVAGWWIGCARDVRRLVFRWRVCVDGATLRCAAGGGQDWCEDEAGGGVQGTWRPGVV